MCQFWYQVAKFGYLVVMSQARERNEWTDMIASQVRAERAARHYTADEVATRAGMSRMTYRRIESAERVADVAQVQRICRAMGLRPSVFMARVEERLSGEPTPPAEDI